MGLCVGEQHQLYQVYDVGVRLWTTWNQNRVHRRIKLLHMIYQDFTLLCKSYAQSVSQSNSRSFGHSVSRLVGYSVIRLVDHSVIRLVGQSASRSISHLVNLSVGPSVSR